MSLIPYWPWNIYIDLCNELLYRLIMFIWVMIGRKVKESNIFPIPSIYGLDTFYVRRGGGVGLTHPQGLWIWYIFSENEKEAFFPHHHIPVIKKVMSVIFFSFTFFHIKCWLYMDTEWSDWFWYRFLTIYVKSGCLK